MHYLILYFVCKIVVIDTHLLEFLFMVLEFDGDSY